MSVILSGIMVALLAQGSGTDALAKHASTLNAAQTFKATFTVQNFPAAAVEYKVEFSKPGMLRIETPSTIYLSDGKTYAEYDKARNEYVVREGDAKKLLQSMNSSVFAVWAAFFLPDQFKAVKSATTGQKLNMKGTAVTPVRFSAEGKDITFFIDPASGIARGGEFKTSKAGAEARTLVVASALEIGGEASLETFSINSLPADAKKVEVSAADMGKWYYNLEEGLKVAKATGRMVFLDFNATWCGPCQMYKRNVFPTPEFKAMAKYYVFVDIDTDEQSALASQYGVTGIPDLRFLKADGTEVHRVVGYKGMALLDDMKLALQKAGIR